MRKLVTALVLLFVCSPGFARIVGKSDIVTSLPSCKDSARYENQMAYVVDATSATVLGAGGGTVSVWVRCLSGTWTIDEVGLSAYVPVTKAGQQTITATGAGNDITLTAADKVALSPALEYEVNAPLVDWNITSGSGETCTDDIDTSSDTSVIRDLVCSASAESTITFRANNSTDAGYARVMVDSQPADLSSVLIQSVPIAGAGSTTAVMVAATSVSVDVAGAADELSIADGAVTVGDGALFYPATASAPPAACAPGTAGGMYYDTDLNQLCVCNGTNWLEVVDMTTGCS